MKKKIVSILCSLLFSATPNLKPILDGRVTPIYLETRYTFTNFEWARGHVYFKDGFDCPSGGTALLDIVEQVDGDIGLNDGTLLLSNHIHLGPTAGIMGGGFIDAQGNRLKLDGRWNPGSMKNIFISSDILIEGNGSSRTIASLWAKIIFLPNVNLAIFKNVDIIEMANNNFVTQSNAPSKLIFDTCRLIIFENFRINCETEFSGACFLDGFPGKSYIFNNTITDVGIYSSIVLGKNINLRVTSL